MMTVILNEMKDLYSATKFENLREHSA